MCVCLCQHMRAFTLKCTDSKYVCMHVRMHVCTRVNTYVYPHRNIRVRVRVKYVYSHWNAQMEENGFVVWHPALPSAEAR